jgi:putative ubiquitin-RnfH superfamily antitoxin RatB of RatAB toxin-antitoxin module
MKRKSLIVTFFAMSLAVVALAGTLASFKWNTTSQNLGKIQKDKPVTITYEFTNSGKDPLKIMKVNVQCGCTVADYTKEAVLPGKSGFVKATFNAATVGTFNKTVTVESNASEGNVTLSFNGEVLAVKPAR